MTDLIATLTELFQETGEAHHQDYIDTDGFDPEWPLYYADHLLGRLNELLGAKLTKGELVYLLVKLSLEQPLEAPGAAWPRYYARVLVRPLPLSTGPSPSLWSSTISPPINAVMAPGLASAGMPWHQGSPQPL